MFEERPWLYYYHELKELKDGTKLQALPFIGALYSMANGENHFMSTEHASKLIKKTNFSVREFISSLYRKLMKYRLRPMTKKFKKNFHFYHV